MPQVESATAFEGPAPPQDAWVIEFRRLLPRWESLRDSSKVIIPISISRVNQFDAARLDVEMSAMLKEQLLKVFSLVKPGLLFQYEPELDAFLEFLIWRFSIWVDKPTVGNALMNLRYRDERAAPITGKEEQVWKDLGSLFIKRSFIVLALLVANIYGHDYSLFLLSVDGAILNRAPPVTFPRPEGKIKKIEFPEDVYVSKFNKKHPDSLYHDAIKISGFDPPPARVFAWRVLELKEQGVREDDAMAVADM